MAESVCQLGFLSCLWELDIIQSGSSIGPVLLISPSDFPFFSPFDSVSSHGSSWGPWSLVECRAAESVALWTSKGLAVCTHLAYLMAAAIRIGISLCPS